MATEIKLFGSANTTALWTVIKKYKFLIVNLILNLILCLNKSLFHTDN
jgi:hypothetical protein